ncbi:MAG: redoxin family protein [Bacteriovorax sp.]|jgi:thiol-disulfide isomerase/thioredoxin
MNEKTKFWLSGLSIFCLIAAGSLIFSKKDKKVTIAGYGFKSKTALSVANGEVGNFSLLDHLGRYQELYRNFDAKAIVIIAQSNDCPIIQKYAAALNELKKKYESKNISFFMINPNKNDVRDTVAKEVADYKYEIPILLDPSQVVTESLGITRSSEAVIIDPNGWKIIYRGAIDDRLGYGVDKQMARNNYLSNKLDSIVANKPDEKNEVAPAKGCLFSFQTPESLSYEKTVAPIVSMKCLNCHAGPTAYLPLLNSYDKFKNWMAMSRETIVTNRMPPSGVDIHYGEYRNNFALTADEKRILVKWIDSGAKRDGTIDPLVLFEKRKKKKNMEKDIAYKASVEKAIIIPPEGTIEYLFSQLGGPTPYDMWISGYNTISTNPRQLHHASLMITTKPLSFYDGLVEKNHPEREKIANEKNDGDIPLFTLSEIQQYERAHGGVNYHRSQIWGAGKPQPHMFYKGIGLFIPKGSYLILESHYMGSGKVESEKMTVEFIGQRTKPAQFSQLRSRTLLNRKVNIPPMTKDHVEATSPITFKEDVLFISLLAHLHMRGKSVRVTLTPPDGQTKTLISIPNYYYGWQTGSAVAPKEPILIKKGSTLNGECRYDNSPQNPNNPDPSKNVLFGQRVDRTEMCNLHFNYIVK